MYVYEGMCIWRLYVLFINVVAADVEIAREEIIKSILNYVCLLF